MATALRTPPFQVYSPSIRHVFPSISPSSTLSFTKHRHTTISRITCSLRFATPTTTSSFPRLRNFVTFATQESETETTKTQEEEEEEEVLEPEILDTSDEDGGAEEGLGNDEVSNVEESPASVIMVMLQSYKEALASDDEAKVTEIENFLKSVEDDKADLEGKVASLSNELSVEKERVLRISADFDNFRKRTDRERLSLVSNAQGEVIENLLPVMDNFERAKSQIKVETEGEEKISNSYQSIYKQFLEILGSLGVLPVDTIGKPFDPLLHEAIMQEESNELEEGIILEEYRKGFQLGDRLLRPSMVKVSSGPGPAKQEQAESSEGEVVTSESESETGDEKDSSETAST